MSGGTDAAAGAARIGGLLRPTWRTIRRTLACGVAAVALSAFGALLIHAYEKAREGPADAAPVVLKPDVDVYKVRPDSPGGMVVPDRDKDVYETIAARPIERKAEHLMPGPERPIAPSRPRAISRPVPAAGGPAKPAASVDAPPTARPPKAADRAPAGGAYRIQLAALRSRSAAEEAWKALLRKHRDLLSRLDTSIRRVDLGAGKGVYFRLQAGSFENQAGARRLCSELAGRKVGCLVVRR